MPVTIIIQTINNNKVWGSSWCLLLHCSVVIVLHSISSSQFEIWNLLSLLHSFTTIHRFSLLQVLIPKLQLCLALSFHWKALHPQSPKQGWPTGHFSSWWGRAFLLGTGDTGFWHWAVLWALSPVPCEVPPAPAALVSLQGWLFLRASVT